MVMQRDPVACGEAFHSAAHAHNGAGRFVAEDPRRRDRAILDLFDVGRADPAHRYFDQ
jgi:hypothetical protein